MAVKILMADGDPQVLELARSTMAPVKWCELVTVPNGSCAQECIEQQRFDGFVTADRMPEADGFALVQFIKTSSLNASIPIVMLTEEKDDVDMMRRGFKAGVTFFATKPSNRERFYRLFNAVRGAMETERRRHFRLPFRTSVTCTTEDAGKNRFVGESTEISEGGIAIQPSGGMELGQILELEFLLPRLSRPAASEDQKRRSGLFIGGDQHQGPQKLRARVRHLAPGGESMGLDFLNLTPSQREIIQEYISGGM